MLCLFEEATPWKIWFQRGQIVQQALVAKVLVSLYHIVLATFDNFELLEGSQKEINHYELDNLKCFMKLSGHIYEKTSAFKDPHSLEK